MQKYIVKQDVTYYAEVEAETAEEAVERAQYVGRIELEAEAAEGAWELVR